MDTGIPGLTQGCPGCHEPQRVVSVHHRATLRHVVRAGEEHMPGIRFTVTVDLEYEVTDEIALLAATQDADRRGDGDDAARLSDSVAYLVESKLEAQTLDVVGARVVGHSLTLPG